MLKKNKWKVILSSVLILLPILFGLTLWDTLPDTLTTHWGADGNADGFSGKGFAVFGLPCILLALHWLCLLFTMLDKTQKDQSPKALNMIFWIVPLISILVHVIMYRATLGKAMDFTLLVTIPLAAMFLFMGNYLPKIKQNRTLGIKVSWTLQNEENWNKTHRFGGKVWVACGFAMLLCALLPVGAFLIAMLCVIAAAVLLPLLYSYLIYMQHQKQGIAYDVKPAGKAEKLVGRISAALVLVILLGIGVLMLTGDVEVDCQAGSLQIHATYWTDIQVEYEKIESIAYRKDLDVGVRTSGFGSARLSLGVFQNEEFGTYTLYAYTGAKEFVVLTSNGKTLVIGLNSAKETKAIYDTLSAKVGK